MEGLDGFGVKSYGWSLSPLLISPFSFSLFLLSPPLKTQGLPWVFGAQLGALGMDSWDFSSSLLPLEQGKLMNGLMLSILCIWCFGFALEIMFFLFMNYMFKLMLGLTPQRPSIHVARIYPVGFGIKMSSLMLCLYMFLYFEFARI